MDQQELPQQTEMVDIYDFPADLINYPPRCLDGGQLYSLHCRGIIAPFSTTGCRGEVAGHEMRVAAEICVACQQADRCTITKVVVDFDLQLLLKGSDGKSWRLRGVSRFAAHALDQTQYPPIQVAFEMSSKEEVV